MSFLDWLSQPVDFGDSGAIGGGDAGSATGAPAAGGGIFSGFGTGLNNLGLLSAGLNDIGASLNGRGGGALSNFAVRASHTGKTQSNGEGTSVGLGLGLNNLGLLSAGLHDIGASLNGVQGNALSNFATRAGQIGQMQRRDALHKQFRSAYDNGDMNFVRQAIYYALPDDVSHITGHLGPTSRA